MSVTLFDPDKLPFVLDHLKPDSFKQGAGRRSNIGYRDFGIGAATGGAMKFIGARIEKEATSAPAGITTPPRS